MTRVIKLEDVYHIAFFTYRSPFSNFYKTSFVRSYSSSEKLYFHSKAIFYGNYEAARRIMQMDRPSRIKLMGQEILTDDRWDEKSTEVMEKCIYYKFTQNPRLLLLLLSTADDVLVEASPSDEKWGIGIAIDDPNLVKKELWRGENRLGRVIMRVRARIKEDPRFIEASVSQKQVRAALEERDRRGIEAIIGDYPSPKILNSNSATVSQVGSSPISTTVSPLDGRLNSSNLFDYMQPKQVSIYFLRFMNDLRLTNQRSPLTDRMNRLSSATTEGQPLTVGRLFFLQVKAKLSGSSFLQDHSASLEELENKQF